MTKQTKRVGKCGGFLRLNPRIAFRWPAFFQITAVSVMFFQFQSNGRAQGNIVDLYNWTNVTMGSDSNPNGYVHFASSTSASFFGGYTDEGGGVAPSILGSLNTTIGETYEISFTMQNQNSFNSSASVSFGNDATNFELPVTYLNGGESYTDNLVNIDFTALATNQVTTMSIECYLDPDDGAATLSDLMVTEVPETSTTRLFCYGGCVVLLTKQLRRPVQKRKLAVKPIA